MKFIQSPTSFPPGKTRLLALGIAVSMSACSAPSTSSLSVKTDAGWIQGTTDGNSHAWLGIPYAQPPVGQLRWHAPLPVHHWQGVRQTTHFGNVCMQTPPPKGPEATLKHAPMSEDCLTLNVWKPSHAKPHHAYPVMVWIHGGAFRLGASSLPLYNGAHLAEQGVIVVTLNYRLGPLSVFPHSALLKANQHQARNYGLLDQIAALHWIQDNIAQFGGNPNNVTIWGESAGGASVGYLLTSPLTKGLFNKAIMESGALALPEYTTRTANQKLMKTLPDSVKHATESQLYAMSAQQLLTLPVAKTATMPIIDGVSLKEKSQQAMAEGHYHPRPLLIGSNNDEAGFFPPAWAASLPGKMGKLWSQASQLTDGYGTHQPALQAAQLATDIFATAPTVRFADSSARYAPTWRYQFSYVTPSQRNAVPGAIHTAEIPYVFGNLKGALATVTPEDRQLASTMMSRWVQFAKTGTPNPPSRPTWPQWHPGTATLWAFGNHGEAAIHEPAPQRLHFLNQHTDIQMN